ncbi:MAG: hypothetical protein QG629_288 [Patescibacteria group bacterium]|nr:hypothetical protein [Candidatus Saccharibacteria bacterium]MDQ5963206.1 hypothetical protein [Patescibacteria group bacterium]
MSINQTVTVNSFYFVNKQGETLRTFPREITWNGRYITFKDGLRYLVGQGTQIFDMVDAWGRQTYRLRRDGDSWTLLTAKGASV